MQKSGIYKLVFSDGCYYAGQTVNITERKREHYRLLLLNKHHNYKVQDKYNESKILPEFVLVEECEPELLNEKESLYINLKDTLCLNIKESSINNYGYRAITAKYLTLDIELAFLILVNNPGIAHKDVAEYVGIDINTVHDISAGRNRAFTEMKKQYPEEYERLIKQKAHNTRGKNTIVLQHSDGSTIKLITGEYSNFCKEQGIQTSNLSKVVKGLRKSTMGWSLLEKYENI